MDPPDGPGITGVSLIQPPPGGSNFLPTVIPANGFLQVEFIIYGSATMSATGYNIVATWSM
jgi:hypothetical protein